LQAIPASLQYSFQTLKLPEQSSEGPHHLPIKGITLVEFGNIAFNPSPNKVALIKNISYSQKPGIRPLIFLLKDHYLLANVFSFILCCLAEAPGNGEALPIFSFKVPLHGREPKQPTFS
jgi:hypothetical protein